MRYLFTLVLVVSFLGCETTGTPTTAAPEEAVAVTVDGDDDGATDVASETPTTPEVESETKWGDVARLTCPDICTLFVTTKYGWPVLEEDGIVFEAVVVPKMEFSGAYEFPVFHGEKVHVWVGGSLEDHDTILEMVTKRYTFSGVYWTKYGDVIKTHTSLVLPGGTYDTPYRFEVVRVLK